MTTEDREKKRQAIAYQLEAALGAGWRKRVALALDIDPSAVRRWFTPPKGRDDMPPACIEPLAEFLNQTPERKWPERWSK
jgi:hypothetical protein